MSRPFVFISTICKEVIIFYRLLFNVWYRDGNSAAYAAARCCWCTAVRSVATKICIMSQRQRSAACYNFLHFFTIIASESFLYFQQWLVMMQV